MNAKEQLFLVLNTQEVLMQYFLSLCMKLSCHLQPTALGVPGEGVTASIRGVDDDAGTC